MFFFIFILLLSFFGHTQCLGHVITRLQAQGGMVYMFIFTQIGHRVAKKAREPFVRFFPFSILFSPLRLRVRLTRPPPPLTYGTTAAMETFFLVFHFLLDFIRTNYQLIMIC